MILNTKIKLISEISYTIGTMQVILRQGCEHPVTNQLLEEEIKRLEGIVEKIKQESEG